MLLKSRLLHRSIASSLRCRYSASAPAVAVPPPLLVKVRDDMKAAMRSKDSARLDVLRGLISETTNAAKTSSPVTTDSHMLQLIRKRAKSSEIAAKEAEDANRDDLRGKELQQVAVLVAYIKDSNFMGEEEVKIVVQQTIGKMRMEGNRCDKGSVMKALVGPGGALNGQLVDRKDVANIVDGML
ncbi:MAG: hypothetical protein Q9164_003108 [Protoblastenia rupestris]